MKRQTLLLFILMLFSASILKAQDADTTKNYQTGEIDVIGLINGLKPVEIPQSVGVLTGRDLNRTNGIHLMNTINMIPGVRMEMRTTTAGTRIVIRGYGNQTNFNGIGYKAYFNDIPLTDADGTTIMDDIDFTTLGRIEVFKGPSSSVYGTGIGGVVKLTTEKAPYGTSVRQMVEGGRYGLFRTNTSVSLGTSKSNLWLNYGHQQEEGFRIHGNSNKNFVTLNGTLYSDNKQTVSIFGNYTYSYDYLSGQVDSNNFYANPDTAEVAYLRNDAHINIESSMIGLSHDYKFCNTFSNVTSMFAEGFTLDQPFAAGLNRTSKQKFGGRTTFTFSPMMGSVKTKFMFGGEYLKNISFNKSYALANNVLGAMTSDIEIRPEQSNVFLQADLGFTKSTTLTLGASYNMVRYDIADMRVATGYINKSGSKKFDGVFTPRVALNQIINDKMSVYASFSQGYSAPTTGSVVNAIGQVNTELKPELANSYEIGTKGSLMKGRFTYEIAGYMMDVKDKLVSQNVAASGTTPSYTVTVNAGKVRYQGVEVGINADITPEKSSFFSLIRPFLSYTYTNAYNVDFKLNVSDTTAAGNLNDKKVSGIAPHLLNVGLDIDTKPGVYLNGTFMFVDKMPISFDNFRNADSYNTLNAKLGFKRALGKNYMLDLFAGADNLTSAKYSQMIFINLTPQSASTKYFNPAPQSPTWYAGASLRYTFGN
ncbi:MAG: TonB-dependent receptor [Ignavibacteria bacterium]|nr:TonB-dependent receptor [Ignavibacteria bacterium]